MLSFFGKGKLAKEFANLLAQELAKRYPPAIEKGIGRKISEKGLSNILEDIYGKAVEFKRSNRLGIYATARLGNVFRWELKELGYSDQFVEMATEGLIVYITKK